MSSKEDNDEYARLLDLRDDTLESLKDLQARLDRANLGVIEAQKAAEDIALKISDKKGGKKWLELKARIAYLAMRGAGRGQVRVPRSPAVLPASEDTSIAVPWYKRKILR